MIILILATLIVLLIVGVPIFMAMGVPGVIMGAFRGPLESIAQLMVGFSSKYLFMCIPLFILAGDIMAKGGASKRLVDMVESFVGHIPGGLALVVVYSCAIFACLTGSTMATVAAIAPIIYKPMIDKGYSVPFTTGVIAASGTLGILFPPSVPLIVYAGITEQSIPALFMAGFAPGIVLTILLTIAILIISKIKNYGAGQRYSWSERRRIFIRSLPVLMLPVIILGGIFSGIFTPTEAAAIAVVYGFAISKFWYKEISWRATWECIMHAAVVVGMVMILTSFAQLFANGLIFLKFSDTIVNFVVSNVGSWILFMLGINIMWLILGMFIDPLSILLLSTPLLYPVLAPLGISPIHFAIVLILNDEIALITPPVGLNLFVLSGVTKVNIETIARGIIPFFVIMIVMLLIVTYWPTLSTFLPALAGL